MKRYKKGVVDDDISRQCGDPTVSNNAIMAFLERILHLNASQSTVLTDICSAEDRPSKNRSDSLPSL
jgi:hypothetical protein